MSTSPIIRSESLRRGLYSTVSLNLVARAISLLQGVVVASTFGLSSDVDFLFYISSTVLLAAALLRGANGAVLIPRFCEIEQHSGRIAATGFFNRYIVIATAMSVVAATATFCAPTAIWRLASSFSEQVIAAHDRMIVCGSVLLVATVVSYFLTDLLTACHIFTPPLVANVLAAMFPIGFLIVDHNRNGVLAVMAGTVVASSLNAIFLAIVAWSQTGWRPWRLGHSPERGIWRDICIAQIGNSITAASAYVVLFLFSSLGPGVVAAVGYARMMANIPRAFIVEHVSSFVGLKFYRSIVANDWTAIRSVFRRAIVLQGVVLWPACAAVWIFRGQIADALFYFRPQSLASRGLVGDLLALQVLVIPFVAIDSLVARVFMASRSLPRSLVIQAAFNVALVVLFFAGKAAAGAMAFVYAQWWCYAVLVCIIFSTLLPRWYPDLNYRGTLVAFLVFGIPGLLLIAAGVIAPGIKYSSMSVLVPVIALVLGAYVWIFSRPIGIEALRTLGELVNLRRQRT